jgi:hypothetical protein
LVKRVKVAEVALAEVVFTLRQLPLEAVTW